MKRIAGFRTAIVLAGGQSRRMGRPKLALKVGTQSLLARTTRVLLACCDEVVVVGGAVDSREALRDALGDLRDYPGIRILHDNEAFQGPLPAIAAGLGLARGEWAFIAAGDTPFLAPALVRGLLGDLAADSETDALIPRVDNCLQPLTAAYRTAAMAPHFRQALENGETSPRRSLRAATFTEVSEATLHIWDPEGRSFLNVNDDDDLTRARDLARQLGESDASD